MMMVVVMMVVVMVVVMMVVVTVVVMMAVVMAVLMLVRSPRLYLGPITVTVDPRPIREEPLADPAVWRVDPETLTRGGEESLTPGAGTGPHQASQS